MAFIIILILILLCLYIYYYYSTKLSGTRIKALILARENNELKIKLSTLPKTDLRFLEGGISFYSPVYKNVQLKASIGLKIAPYDASLRLKNTNEPVTLKIISGANINGIDWFYVEDDMKILHGWVKKEDATAMYS